MSGTDKPPTPQGWKMPQGSAWRWRDRCRLSGRRRQSETPPARGGRRGFRRRPDGCVHPPRGSRSPENGGMWLRRHWMGLPKGQRGKAFLQVERVASCSTIHTIWLNAIHALQLGQLALAGPAPCFCARRGRSARLRNTQVPQGPAACTCKPKREARQDAPKRHFFQARRRVITVQTATRAAPKIAV